MKIKALKEKKNSLISEMENLVLSAQEETRSLNDVEDARFLEIKEEIEKIDAEIVEARSSFAVEDKKNNEIRGNEMNKELEMRNVADYIKGNMTEEVRTMQTSNSGGIIPTTLHDQIIEKLEEVAPLFSKARLFQSENGKIDIVKESEAVSEAAFVGENEDLTAEDFRLEKVTLSNKRAGSAIVLTNALVQDAGIDVAEYSVGVLAKRLGKALDKVVINGDKGAGQPEGLLNAPAKCEVETAVSGVVGIEDFITAYNRMHPSYLAKACWIMNKETFDAISKLKDATGNYYIVRDVVASGIVHKLLGLPVEITTAMADPDKVAILVNMEAAYATMVAKNGSSLKMISADTNNSLRGTMTLVLETSCDGAIYNEDAVLVIKKHA